MTETAVDNGGSWFSRHQRKDGGWPAKDPAVSDPGATGLALLAFLGAGYTDRGSLRENKYSTIVRDGLRFLMAHQHDNGRIGSGALADHAIATLALCEAYWMTRNPRYKLPAERAIAHSAASSEAQDIATAGWCAIAVKSALRGRLTVPPGALEAARKGLSGIADPSVRATAVRLTGRILLGEDPRTSAEARKEADRCAAHPALADKRDHLYWYFATLGMFQVGGAHWKTWNKHMKDAIVEHQLPRGSGDDSGSWDPDDSHPYGRVGSTALLTMCLEVYYRYDRVFGLGGGAGGGWRGRGGRRVARARGGFRSGERPMNTEAYDRIEPNRFHHVRNLDVSTFALDVDTASYANVRRFLTREFRLPPKDAVRVEELVNYFDYDDAPPAADGKHPFAVHLEVAGCPWNERHRLARIALKAKSLPKKRPAANLVFLVDVSGSMRSTDKLPLVKESLRLLVHELAATDRIALCVYAGAAGLVLPPTSCERKAAIIEALGRLESGGSTNGGAGIQLAYRVAAGSFVEGGINRVLLATDGDFNVGISDRGALTRLIEEQAKSGVFLSVLGFGRGNLKDATMEDLSNRGNGNYAYIDSLTEARKVLVSQMDSTLAVVAKDVKIQLFFNPARVAGWRLLGYENRLLKAEDFNDDKKDAGEIGAGHTMTALYELIPAGREVPGARADENPFLKRQSGEGSDALFRIRLRYKAPAGATSTLLERDCSDGDRGVDAASTDFRWAAAVAGFGMLLRDSPHKGALTWERVLALAAGARGKDAAGYRAGFVEIARSASRLAAIGTRETR